MSIEFNSAKEYAALLIETLYEAVRTAPVEEKIPDPLFDLWCIEIEEYAEMAWNQCMLGERSAYELEEEEIRVLWDRAVKNYTTLTIEGLVDKDLVKVSIDDKGDIVYGLTDKGQQVVDDLPKEDK